MSGPAIIFSTERSPHFHTARAELPEANSTARREESLRLDAAAIREALKLSVPAQDPTGQHTNDSKSLILTIAKRNLLQLVAVRQSHQPKCAAKSVKTCSNPQDSTPKPASQSDRQQLCAQMAEVVRRAGTGLEQDAWWRTKSAPGTQGLDETLTLTGNSANAEVVAKVQVNTVGYSDL